MKKLRDVAVAHFLVAGLLTIRSSSVSKIFPRTIVAGLILLMMVPLASFADAYEPLGSEGRWQFALTPYLWLAARSDITSTIHGQTVGVELTFKQLIENFDVFLLGSRFEAWKDRFGLIFDGMWVKTNTSKAVTGPGPLGIVLSADNVELQQATFDFAGSYRLLEQPLRQRRKLPVLYFDPILGLRVNYLKQEAKLRLKGPIRERATTLGDEKTWVELMIGGCFVLQVLENLSFTARGSVSGFGIGDGSDLQWDFLAGADYRPWQRASFKVGYRVYQIDYQTGTGRDTFGYDTTQHGPWLGVSFYF